MKKIFGILLLLTFISLATQAGVLLETGGTYLTDSMTSSTPVTTAKYAYEVGAFFSASKNLWGGWKYSGFSSSDTRASVTTLITGQDTGPSLLWQFGRNKNFSMGFTYNLISRANFANGTTTEDWEGSGYVLQIGANPEIKNNFRIGITLNYYSATYSTKKVNNVESGASYSRNWLYPALALTKEF